MNARGRGGMVYARGGLLALVALGMALVMAGGLAAQDRPGLVLPRSSCRCLDDDGDVIEHCVCIDLDRTARAPFAFFRDFGAARARIGVSIPTAMDEETSTPGGVPILSVVEDGPADHAGLEEGDVVVALDGHSLREPLDQDAEDDLDENQSLPAQRFMALMSRVEPGDTVVLSYVREGRTRTAEVVAEANRVFWSGQLPMALGSPRDDRGAVTVLPRRFEVEPQARSGSNLAFFLGGGDVDGLELRKMEPGLGSYFHTDRGVLVLDAPDGSPLGLQAGDVILAVGGREVTDPGDVARILRSYEAGEDVTFRIVRKGEDHQITGTRR